MGVLTQEEYKVIVQNCLKTTEFEIVECEEKELTGNYETFSGKTVQLSLVVKKQDREQPAGLYFFLKQYPEKGGFHEAFIKAIRIFYKETHLYNRFLNKLNDNIKGKIFAKCYFAKPDEFLVLEDLSRRGFKSRPPGESLDGEHVELTLNCLAKFHAASIIFEESHETKIDKVVPDVLFEPLFVSDPGHPGFHHLCVGINATEAIVDAYFGHVPPEVCEKAYTLMRLIPEKMRPSKKRRNVLNHGNMSSNSVMFSYNFEGRVEEARIVDFKLARYCVPVFDLLLFIYMTTTHALREIDMESFLIHYYNAFARELADADIDVKTILTWAEFKASVEEELPNVLAIAAFYSHFYAIPNERLQPILSSPDKYEAFIKDDRSQLVLELMCTDEHFRKHVTQAISDLLEYAKNN